MKYGGGTSREREREKEAYRPLDAHEGGILLLRFQLRDGDLEVLLPRAYPHKKKKKKELEQAVWTLVLQGGCCVLVVEGRASMDGLVSVPNASDTQQELKQAAFSFSSRW